MSIHGFSNHSITWLFSRLLRGRSKVSQIPPSSRQQQTVTKPQSITAKASSRPVIILIHGAWHLPSVWVKVKQRLEAAGYEVYAPRLLTVVGPEPVDYSWRVDVAVVHDIVLPLFDQGRQAVIVGHSYGGLVATASVEGQSVADRHSRGLQGGFSAVVYICAFPIAKRGSSLLSTKGGDYSEWTVKAESFKRIPCSMKVVPGAAELYYSDLPPDEAKEWIADVGTNYQSQRSFEEPLGFCANDIEIPMTYLLCEGDKAVPVQSQEQMVAEIPRMKTRRCTAGHSPFLSQPDFTAEVIVEAARNV
ncbi:Alpha/beta hydrolase fold-1 [Xylaria sp. FL0933]|nr:Alpha/beta hydrolase fold-1 [Xylaria sp. FL0933]